MNNLHLCLFAVALSLPTITLGQVVNVSTIPVHVIPDDNIAGGGECPSDERIQETLRTIKMQITERLPSSPPVACGDPSVWRPVANIDMSEQAECPTGLSIATHDTITGCGRMGDTVCSVVMFDTSGTYSQVCGRIRGYQWGETNAFYSAIQLSRNTIDQQYLDGVSLTHGGVGNREHIWSFAAGRTQDDTADLHDSQFCPCALPESDASTYEVPSFINDNYFCESGAEFHNDDMYSQPDIFSDNPLWDGQNCVEGNRCCEFNSPPWFTRVLSSPTSDAIELRLCLGGASKEVDIPLDLIELYVQ